MPESSGWPMPTSVSASAPVSSLNGRDVLYEVMQERMAQLVEHSEVEDDLLPAEAWIAKLVKHAGRAVTLDPAVFRVQMIRVAAIALAAVEWVDRKHGS